MNTRRWLVVGVCLALTACGEEKLLGTWVSSDPASKMTLTYTFNADGTGSQTLSVPAELKRGLEVVAEKVPMPTELGLDFGSLAAVVDKPQPLTWGLQGDTLRVGPAKAQPGSTARPAVTRKHALMTKVKVEGDTLTGTMRGRALTFKRKA